MTLRQFRRGWSGTGSECRSSPGSTCRDQRSNHRDHGRSRFATEVVALAEEDVRSRGAFFEGAIGATGTKVADAANVLEGIPGLGVGLGGFVSELFLLDAAATAVAVGGAYGTLACLAVFVTQRNLLNPAE